MASSYRQLVLNVEQAGKARQFVINKDEKFTVGQRGNNDLTIFGQHLPKRHTLIAQKNGAYIINIRPFVDGTISLDDSTLRIKDLIQHDILPRNGDDMLLKLTPHKHGFLTIGDAKIEFAFMQVKPRQAVIFNTAAFSWQRAVLRGLTSDLLFKSIFLILMILNSLMIYAFKDYKITIASKFDIEKIPERLAQFIIKPPENIFEADTKSFSGTLEDAEKTEETDKQENQKSSQKRVEKRKSNRKRGNPAASAGLLGLIGGTGSTSKSSSIVDALVDKGLVADLNNIVNGGTHLKVTKDNPNNNNDLLDQLIGTGGSGGIDDFLAELEDDVPQVNLTKKAKVDLVKPSKMTGSEEALGQRNEQSIWNVVSSRQGRIKYLYEKYLKRLPNLRGKITIEFTIAANGFVLSTRVIESTINHPELEQELVRLIQRLKFDPIPAGNVTTVFPFVFSNVN